MSSDEIAKIKASQKHLLDSMGRLQESFEQSQGEIKAEIDEGFKGIELLLNNVLGEFRQLNKDVQDLKDKI